MSKIEMKSQGYVDYICRRAGFLVSYSDIKYNYFLHQHYI